MSTVVCRALRLEDIKREAPAAFAQSLDTRRTSIQFIGTVLAISALQDVGFHPTLAQQSQVRKARSAVHARHMIRFFYIKTELALADAIQELILITSHAGTSAYIMLILICQHKCAMVRNSAQSRGELHIVCNSGER